MKQSRQPYRRRATRLTASIAIVVTLVSGSSWADGPVPSEPVPAEPVPAEPVPAKPVPSESAESPSALSFPSRASASGDRDPALPKPDPNFPAADPPPSQSSVVGEPALVVGGWLEPPPVPEVYYGPPRSEKRPKYLSYEPGPVPDGYILRSAVHRGLFVPGVVALGVSWTVTTLIAIMPVYHRVNQEGDDWLPLPVVGPWIAMSMGSNMPDRTLIGSGLIQTAGVTAIVLGVVFREKRFVLIPKTDVALEPAQLAPGAYGARLSAVF